MGGGPFPPEAGRRAAAAGLVEVHLSMPDSDYSLLKLPRNLHELQILTGHLENYTSDYTVKATPGRGSGCLCCLCCKPRPEDEHALLCIRSEPHGMSDVGLEHDAYHAEEMTPEQLITEEKLSTQYAGINLVCMKLF
ncbi:hypothetical protein ZWY2020_049115 [Hordeum vulgare]|nr:hypothetical protein ZWY2020_049115 [Hordeum vulgare]